MVSISVWPAERVQCLWFPSITRGTLLAADERQPPAYADQAAADLAEQTAQDLRDLSP
jgi:hypothetical protein